MMTLFLIGFAGTAVILGSIPFVVFALMLETCSARRAVSPGPGAVMTSGVRSRKDAVGFARAA